MKNRPGTSTAWAIRTEAGDLGAAASASSASIQRLGAERTAGSELGLLGGRRLRR
jgi:hypothetical protein